MAEMEPNDYQMARIALLAGISARAVELGEEILTEAEDMIDDLQRENTALREALVALRHARDLEIETSQSWRTDRAWREGWAKVDAALAAVPAAARSKVMYDVQMTADEAAEIDARRDARGERERAALSAIVRRSREEANPLGHPSDWKRALDDCAEIASAALDAPPAGRGGE